ncbi:MAG: hypothetical protein ABTQ31_07140, partial [Rhizobiaceae bacterium]
MRAKRNKRASSTRSGTTKAAFARPNVLWYRAATLPEAAAFHVSRKRFSMAKIKVANPVVELDGDE